MSDIIVFNFICSTKYATKHAWATLSYSTSYFQPSMQQNTHERHYRIQHHIFIYFHVHL